MNFFMYIYKRWVSETPKFFKRLGYLSFGISGSITAAYGAAAAIGVAIPATWSDIMIKVLLVTAAIGSTSKLTSTNPPEKQ